MTDSLRERLAARLFDVVWEARHRPVDPNTLYSVAQKTEYADLADEVIRCMEWARQERVKEAKRMVSQRRAPGGQWVSSEDTLHGMDLLDDPLTLPPEDWKPSP